MEDNRELPISGATLGELILISRRRKKISMQDAAKATGVSVATISRMENDKDCLFFNVLKVAIFLDIPLGYLLDAALDTMTEKSKSCT